MYLLASSSPLATLEASGLLDGRLRPAFDRLSRLATRLLGVPVALVTLGDEERSRVAGAAGLPGAVGDLVDATREAAFCRRVMATGAPLLVEDADIHPLGRGAPGLPALGTRAYLGVPLGTADGACVGVVCAIAHAPRAWTATDVEALTELAAVAQGEVDHHLAARAVRDREARYRAVLDAIPVGVFIADAVGGFAEVNQRVAEIWGGAPGAAGVEDYVAYRAHWPATGELVAPDAWPLARALQSGARILGERIDITRFDGAPAVILNHAAPIRDAHGAIAGAVVAITDITEEVAASTARRAAVEASEALTRATFDAMPGSMAIIEPETGRLLEFNDAACEALGYTRAEFAALSIPDLDADPDRAAVAAIVQQTARLDQRLQFRRVHRTKQGEPREVLVTSRAFDGVAGRRIACTWIDVTEQAALEATARAQTAVLETVLANIPLMVALYGADGAVQWVSREWERVLGWSVEAMQQQPDLMTCFYPDPAERTAADAFLSVGGAEWRPFTPRSRAGEPIPSSWRNVRLADGRLLGIGRDERAQRAAEAERARAQDALRASEERYALAARATRSVVWEWDVASGTASWSSGIGAMFGYSAAELVHPITWWEACIHPDDRTAIVTSVRAAAASADAAEWRGQYRFRRADGEWAHVVDRGYLARDAAGTVVRMIGAMEDVTEQRQLEERLRQAQKMEAVGQLAGGVAHDFNNLLTVITGNLEFLRGDLAHHLAPDHPAHGDMEEIAQAGDRARGLVRQLLTFSRRQPVCAQRIQLGAVVEGAEKLLRRVIGEEITLEVAIDDEAWHVEADPGQLEQVLMNLAVNARDAMLTPLHGHPGRGGALTLEVDGVMLEAAEARLWEGVRPGPCVRLRVHDTGHGMDATTQAHAFEPFFTTKPVGAGTGLGLATVFGIVRQAGGAIRADSEPGSGTTFTILLPAHPVSAAEAVVASPASATPHGCATVLLVEDETPVRSTARRMLERRGYTVLEARHGADALLVWQEHRDRIAVVVTDLRMPELGGRELVATLRAERPSLRSVVMSGYADQACVPGDCASQIFVAKPFTGDALLDAVARVLHAPA